MEVVWAGISSYFALLGNEGVDFTELVMCTAPADTVILAHMLMVPTNYRKRHIFQATL
jgi:hypothetical protein